MSVSIAELQLILENIQTDVDKFNNGNMSAGTRIRKAMQEIKEKLYRAFKNSQ